MTNYDYRIEKTRFGLYTSYLTENDEPMVTAATEAACRTCTDLIHIPSLKGEFTGYTSIPKQSSFVKL